MQRVQGQLDDAGDMAPHPPGLFASLWHDAETVCDTAVHGLSSFVHDKALLEFISGVANIVATVAGLLALTLLRLLEVLTVSYLSRSPPGPRGARLVSVQAASWKRARACALATLM